MGLYILSIIFYRFIIFKILVITGLRTKKEIQGENVQIRAGCKVILKGEVYERMLFTIKDTRFKSEGFLDEVKRLYTDLINLYVKDEKEQLKVFDRNGVYLPMKKIGKNNPKAEQIIADNQMRTKWNLTVDSALVSGLSEKQIMSVKQIQISQKSSHSIRQNGNQPELFSQLLEMAIRILEIFIREILSMISMKEDKDLKVGVNTTATVITAEPVQEVHGEKVEVTDPEQKIEKAVPEYPKQTELASKYVRLVDVYEQLLKQSTAIDQKKQDIEGLEKELAGTKGIFKSKQRKMLQVQIDQAGIQLANMEQRLPAIVKQYHYESVKEFMVEFMASKGEYEAYQKAVQMYENDIDIKPERESIKARMERHEQEIKVREVSRQYTSINSKNRGAR